MTQSLCDTLRALETATSAINKQESVSRRHLRRLRAEADRYGNVSKFVHARPWKNLHIEEYLKRYVRAQSGSFLLARRSRMHNLPRSCVNFEGAFRTGRDTRHLANVRRAAMLTAIRKRAKDTSRVRVMR